MNETVPFFYNTFTKNSRGDWKPNLLQIWWKSSGWCFKPHHEDVESLRPSFAVQKQGNDQNFAPEESGIPKHPFVMSQQSEPKVISYKSGFITPLIGLGVCLRWFNPSYTFDFRPFIGAHFQGLMIWASFFGWALQKKNNNPSPDIWEQQTWNSRCKYWKGTCGTRQV